MTTPDHETGRLIRRIQAEYVTYFQHWSTWLVRLDTQYVAYYGITWLKRHNGDLDRIGVGGVEVGVQWLRENRYFAFADFLDYEPTNLFAMVPEMRRLHEQRTDGGVQ